MATLIPKFDLMDGGSTPAGAINRPINQKLSDIVSVKDFGAKGDGTTDDAVAIQNAINSSYPVYFPSGTYVCSAKITKTAGFFHIFGDGANISEIKFTSSTTNAGFEFTQQTDKNYAKITGLTISTSTGYVSGKTALYVNGSPQVTAGSPRGITLNRSERRILIDDVEIRGIGDSGTTGWGIGIRMTSLGWVNISNYAFLGDYSQGATTGNWQGYAIQIDGDGMPVENKFSNLSLYSAYAGIFLPDYFEGLYVTHFDMVNVQYGILAEYTVGVSFYPSQTLCGLLQPTITNGHINCRKQAIRINTVNQAFISNLNIYLNPQNADTNFIGINLINGASNTVHNNSIGNQNQSLATTLAWAILLTDVSRSFILGNSSYYFKGAGIFLNTLTYGSQNNFIFENFVFTSSNIISLSSLSTSNYISLNAGISITSDDYTLGVNNAIIPKQYAGSFVISLTGGAASEVVSIAIPSAYFKNTPSSAFLMSTDSDQIIGWYSFATSSNISAKFTVANRSGANLTAGNHRFSLVVYE